MLLKDPLLLALANNGGPTDTNADQHGSPGRAYIPFAGGMCGTGGGAASNVDQRGYARGAGSRCDIGAFEFSGLASAVRGHALPVVLRGHHPRIVKREQPKPRSR
jgi:hypothetical protein